MSKSDIITEKDIETMVRNQYALLLADEITSPKFLHLNIEEHLPRIIGFWKMIIFSTPASYTGNAFQPHLKLNLEKIHFDKWNEFLTLSVNNNFVGQNAEKVLQHAKLMTVIFQSKMGIQ